MRIDDPHSGLEFLDRDQCLALLHERSGKVGRLAFVEGVHPTVLPVNFVMDGNGVALRTGMGLKLSVALRRAAVAFQVDRFDEDERTGWSVLVRGTSEVVDRHDDLDRLNSLGLVPWANEAMKPVWVRISADLVTGRRIDLLTPR